MKTKNELIKDLQDSLGEAGATSMSKLEKRSTTGNLILVSIFTVLIDIRDVLNELLIKKE